MTPLLLLVMNVTLLAHHPTWEFGRLSPFAVVAEWLRTPATPGGPKLAPTTNQTPPTAIAQNPVEPANPASQTPVASAESVAPVGSAKDEIGTKARTPLLARKYLIELVRSVGVPFLVLALLGFCCSLGSLRDPRVALLPVWTVATLVAIWIQLVHAGEMNGRYFLTPAFVDAGFAAIGCLTVVRWLQAALWQPTNRINRLVAAGLVPACLLAAGWTQSFSTRHNSRRLEVKLGQWTQAQSGPVHRAVSDFQAVRPAYFAAGGLPEVVKYDEFFDAEFDRDPPDLLVINPHSFAPRLLPYFLERATDLGLVPLDQQAFSSAPAKFLIYVRPRQMPKRPESVRASVAHLPTAAPRN
jgi:hypothetical protein